MKKDQQWSKKSWRIAAIIAAGILVLGGIVWGGYYLGQKSEENASQSESPSPSASASATPDTMAGWQTYTNNFFGFEVKFPREWHRTRCEEPGDEGFVAFSDKVISDFRCGGENFPLPVNIKSTKYNNSEASYYLNLFSSNPLEYYSLNNSTKTDISLSGINAVKIEGFYSKPSDGVPLLPDGTKEIQIIFVKDKNLFELNMSNVDGKDYTDVFNRILSTFRFTK